MRNLLFTLVAVLCAGSTAWAQAKSANSQPTIQVTWVQMDAFAANNQLITPEAGLKLQKGLVMGSMFAFSDIDFTPPAGADVAKLLNVSGDIGMRKLSWIRFRMEYSGNPNKVMGEKIGPLFRLTEVPGIGKAVAKAFAALNAAYHFGVGGSAPKRELYILYISRPLRFGSWDFSAAGFHRFRYNLPDAGQYQLLVGHRRLGPLKALVEVDWLTHTCYAGAKVNFLQFK